MESSIYKIYIGCCLLIYRQALGKLRHRTAKNLLPAKLAYIYPYKAV